MKKFLLSVLSVGLLTAVNAQNCADLFLSEYVEGTSNNKAIEIYNPTNQPINLSTYRFIRWDNGSVPPNPPTDISTIDPSKVQPLPNVVIQPYDVYVIALNLTDPGGTGQTAPIDTALQSKADTLLSNGCGSEPGNIRSMCFNGDDALELQKNVGGSWVSVDIFASIGERPIGANGTTNPTAAWTAIAPYSSMPPTYDSQVSGPYFLQYWTQDQTMRRKSTILAGVTTNPAPETFNPSVQWDTVGTNNFAGLGTHTCDCENSASVDNEVKNTIRVYPNPSTDVVFVQTAGSVKTIEVYNLAGKLMWSTTQVGDKKMIEINVRAFQNGVYMIKSTLQNGYIQTSKFVKF